VFARIRELFWPELKYFGIDNDRWVCFRQAMEEVNRTPVWRLMTPVAFVVALACWWLAGKLTGSHGWSIVVPVSLVVCLPLWLLMSLHTRCVRRSLRRMLREKGICSRCGYDMRGSPSGRCPECGESVGLGE